MESIFENKPAHSVKELEDLKWLVTQLIRSRCTISKYRRFKDMSTSGIEELGFAVEFNCPGLLLTSATALTIEEAIDKVIEELISLKG
jgi:hypothetical protein